MFVPVFKLITSGTLSFGGGEMVTGLTRPPALRVEYDWSPASQSKLVLLGELSY